jgi:glutamate-5-semialdehyde dehydrogenase
MSLTSLFQQAKDASRQLAVLTEPERNDILLQVADAVEEHAGELLEANAVDLAAMDSHAPLYDRLLLTADRLDGIAADMRHVAGLPSPLGRVSHARTLDNGLRLHRVSVPFGVIGVVYEARPNVTFDVFSLCFKSGNACVLKGGRDADHTNRVAVGLIHDVLQSHGVDSHAVVLLPPTHEATGEMLSAVGYIDLCIPRGGRRLIDFVRDTARIPVIETGAGVVSTYFDQSGDLAKGRAIVLNAKTRRVAVCNALDCLIVHEQRLADLPALVEPLAAKQVTLYADNDAYRHLEGLYPADLLRGATPEAFGTEYMDYKLAVCVVPDIQAALAHIARYGSGHSESIITEDEAAARLFQARVDAACVYWNAPTSFTDGAQFGLGAEIGISTQKLGPRGPMGLEEICTYKWIIEGDGQTRP